MKQLVRLLTLCALPVTLLLSGSARGAGSTHPSRPNIIFILVDDLGYGDVGVLFQNQRTAGEPRLRTPALDQMAVEGMILTNHYCASPVCAPSRGSILQGMNQGHCDNRDNQFDEPLPPNHTVATVLKTAGYVNGAVGKWGLAGHNPPWPSHPLVRGFDQFYGFLRHKDAHNHYPGNKGGVFDGRSEVAEGLDGLYDSDLFTAWAKAFITEHGTIQTNRPFFLYLAYTLPHMKMQLPPAAYPEGRGLHGGLRWPLAPFGKSDSYVYPAFEHEPWPEEEKRHASMIARLDDCVGDVLQLLRDLKIERNTLVVFTSDNGPHNEGHDPRFFDSWGPFDGIKRDLLEGGAREPAIAWWPGTIAAGQTGDILSANYDWLPTFAELGGVPAPARTDGISLVPTLTDHSSEQVHHPYLYSEYLGTPTGPLTSEILARHGYQKRGQEQAVRIGRLVALRYDIKFPSDPLRLYDVMKDPKETSDLSADPQYRMVFEHMRDLLVTARTADARAPRPYDDVPLPSVEPPMDSRGLTCRTFEGKWPWMPKFAWMKPGETHDVNGFLLADANGSEPWGAEYVGLIHVPADGKYVVSVQSDSGIDFWIHDNLLIDDDFTHDGSARSGSVPLKAGWHPVRLDYRHDSSKGACRLDVHVRLPDGSDAGNSLQFAPLSKGSS